MYKLADGTMSTDYKAGDKFVVTEATRHFATGEVITLSEDDETPNPWFNNGKGSCHWSRLKTYKPKEFTKSDLKDGMVVTYRDGSRRFLLAGALYGKKRRDKDMFRGGCLVKYTNDLRHSDSYCQGLDIMEVEYRGEVLWERIEDTPEQKEIKRLKGIIKEAQDALNVINSGNNGECDE